MRALLQTGTKFLPGPSVKVKFWGTRGSIPVPGPATARYGGNTSCVELTLSDGSELILDAGTGIRELGRVRSPSAGEVNLLLTHLHLDHVQGLLFFAPLFDPRAKAMVWGPRTFSGALLDRLARYVSAPLSPIEMRELPARVSFEDSPPRPWRVGPATIEAAPVSHRGPTLGYRIEDAGTTVCYIPDHEPGLGQDLAHCDARWISGHALACDADLLIHDGQYFDSEYPGHVGWGHSRVTDAVEFARRSGARRLALFHHDPVHSDADVDRLAGAALSAASFPVIAAVEGATIEA
ncbi:MAG: MBL fold metallo-hydrolase [Thermoleophilaceae bacterium]